MQAAACPPLAPAPAPLAAPARVVGPNALVAVGDAGGAATGASPALPAGAPSGEAGRLPAAAPAAAPGASSGSAGASAAMPHPSQPRASGGGTAAAALGLLPRGTTVVVQPGTQYAPREDFSFDDICALAQRIEKGEVLMAWLKQQDDQGRPKYGIARSTPS